MRRIILWLVVLTFCLARLPGTTNGQAPQPQRDPRMIELRGKLSRELNQLAADFDGVMGIAVIDLTTEETLSLHADMVFPQASSIKIPILVELFRQAQAGTLKLDERVEVKRAEMGGGSGVLQHLGDATSAVSLRDLAVLMIVLSDNTATNLLIDRVGMASINDSLQPLGLTQTRLQRKMMDQDAQRASRENLSSPREMATLLERLYQGKLLDADHTAAALEILKYTKDTPLRRGLPEGVSLADKPGSLPGVRCDSGIVLLASRPYVIAVMTTYAKDGEAAERAISDASRRVHDYFERLARSNAHGVRLP